jgi:hypothetical protein
MLLIEGHPRSMSENAFHEKAGLCQLVFLFCVVLVLVVCLIDKVLPFAQFAAVATLPCAVVDELFFARCKLGVSRFSRCCHLISDLFSIRRIEVGPGILRSHRNSALGFGSPLILIPLCCCSKPAMHGSVEGFINFPTYPQPMQQHR